MEATEKTNCLRIFILIVDFIKEGLTNLIDFDITKKGITFEDFINQHQHDIYHYCYSLPCCQCPPRPPRYGGRAVYPSQLAVLFDTFGNSLFGHKSSCIVEFCCSKAKPGLSVTAQDVTLARFLLINYCKLGYFYPFSSFEDFLNANKHDIFHMCVSNSTCCLCTVNYQRPLVVSCLQNEWQRLFSVRCPPCMNCKSVSGSTSVCSYLATLGIKEKNVQQIILEKFVEHFRLLGNAVNILTGIRNARFGHIKDVRINNSDFELTWSNTKKELLRIADICGTSPDTESRLDSIKQRTLDETLLAHYQITLQEEFLRKDEIKTVVEGLVVKVDMLEEKVNAIPKNTLDFLSSKYPRFIAVEEKRRICEENTNIKLDDHKNRDTYVSTRGQQAAMTELQDTGIVVITGPPGAGKSSMGMELQRLYCSTFQDYIPIILDKVTDWKNIVNVDHKVIVFLDDIFGRTNCNYDENIHSDILSNIDLYINKGIVKVIISMRENIRRSCKEVFDRHVLLNTCSIVDLGSQFEMNSEEKLECLKKHCEKNKIQVIDENESLKESLDKIACLGNCKILGFPESCYLFTSVNKFTQKGLSFFSGANKILCNDILEKFRTNEVEYTILIFVLLNNSSIDISVDNLESIKQLYQSIYSDGKNVTNWDVSHAFDHLKRKYLISRQPNLFRFQHRAIFEAVLLSFKGFEQTNVLTLMDLDFIIEMARPDGYISEDEVCVSIPKKNYKFLATKIVSAILKTSSPYDCVERLMRSPVIRLSGSDIMQHLIEISHGEDVCSCFGKSPSTKTSRYLFIQSRYFELTVAMFFFCKEGDPNFSCLRNGITKKLKENDCSDLRNLIVDLFFSFCLKYDHVKAKGFSEIMSKHNVHISDWKNPITSLYLLKVLEDPKALMEFCKVMDDSQIENINYVLIEACNEEALEAVKLFLEKYQSLISETDRLMQIVCASNNLELVQLLLEKFGVDSFNAKMALNEACLNSDNVDLVRLLFSKFPHNHFDIKTAFNNVCRKGHVQVANFLINASHVDESRLDSKTAFNKACLRGDDDMFTLLKDGLTFFKTKMYSKLEHSHGEIPFNDFVFEVYKETEKYVLSKLDETEVFELNEEDSNIFQIIQPIIISIIQTNTNFQFTVPTACENVDDIYNRISYFLMILEKEDQQQIQIWLSNTSRSAFEKFSKELDNGVSYLIDPVALQNMVYLALPYMKLSLFHEITIVKLLLEKFPHSSFDAVTAMNAACKRRNIKLIELLLRSFDKKLFDVNSAMREALELPSFSKNVVMLLLDNFDKSYFHSNMLTSHFIQVCSSDQEELVIRLLKTIDIKEIDFLRAFTLACCSNTSKIAEILIDFIVDHNVFDSIKARPCILENTDTLNNSLDYFKRKLFDVKVALNVACQSGKVKVVEKLLVNFNDKKFNKNRAMICASRSGKIDVVKLLVQTLDLHKFDYRTVFRAACLSGQIRVVKFLVENFDQQRFDANISVTAACKSGQVDVVQFILKTFGQSLVDTKSALNGACRSGRVSMVEFVLETFGQSSIDKKSAINNACRSGEVDVLKLVISKLGKSCVNLKKALNEACLSGNIHTVKFLLDSFVHEFVDKTNLMKSACRSGNVEMLNYVLKNFNQDHFDKKSAVNEACRSGNVNMVKFVINTFSLDSVDANSALNEACRSGRIDVVEFILQTFYPINIDHKSAINAACGSGNVIMVNFALDTFDPKYVDTTNAVNEACRRGNVEVIEFLVDTFGRSSVDVNSAMIEACTSGAVSPVRFIFETFGGKLVDGERAIYAACRSGEVDVLEFVLQTFRKNAFDEQVAIDEAFRSGNVDMVRFVLDTFAQYNVDALSVMNEACISDNVDMARFVLEKFGKNQIDLEIAMMHACKSGGMDVLEFLLVTFDHNTFNVRGALDFALSSYQVNLALTLMNSIDYSAFDVNSAIIKASAHLSVDIVEFLCNKYDVNNLDLNVVMKQACADNNIPLIHVLIKNVDHSFLDIKTASITACENGNIQVVKVLLEKNDPTLIDLQYVYDAAIKIGDIDIAAYVFQFLEILYERNKD